MFRTALCVLLALAGSASAARFPGGLLDPTGRAAYVRVPGGFLAVDLATGSIPWQTTEAQQPLLVVGERLYGLAVSNRNEVCLLGFDLSKQGKCVYRSAPIVLPRWAVTAEKPGHTFSFHWVRDKQMLFFDWHVTARATNGPPKEAHGRVQIDLRMGTVRTVEAPAPAAPEDRLPSVLDKLSVRWRRPLAGRLHALILETLPGKSLPRTERFVLRTWHEKTGKAGFTRELLRGSRLEVLVSHDDNHLWLRDAGGMRTESPSRHWTLFAVVDGTEVAHVPYLPGTREVLVLETRAYCLLAGPARPGPDGRRSLGSLVALDLDTGLTLWRTSLGGPMNLPSR